MFEGALTWMAGVIDATMSFIRDEPWLCAGIAAVVCLVIFSRRK
jgi:ElaB/YqjD/DUF883 family membrane-anchored ribosome-binding protein